MRIAALIVAAGKGKRAGDGPPKQYRRIGGRPVIARSRDAFRLPMIDAVAIVIHPGHRALFDAALPRPDALVVEGGAERADSVRAGLEALAAHKPDIVLIHDAARPFVSPDVIGRVIASLDDAEGAIAAIPIVDALWREQDGACAEALARDGLWRAQTPQGFRFDAILKAHRDNADPAAPDDAALARASGMRVALVESEADNFKLTRPADFDRAARLLEGRMETRMGTGFDVHAFGPGDHVMLGGVAVPHEKGFLAHSDGDVALHALTDAVLGALALGDIGRWFPPSDPQWKGASSDRFLAHAVEMAAARGFAIVNLDLTLLCERPKIGPHVEAMRTEIARIAGCDASRVSVKATTTERLGFTGREEGVAAQAAAVLRGKPS